LVRRQNCEAGKATLAPGAGKPEPGSGLRVVVMVVVTVMVFASGEGGACNNQQEERGEN